MTLIAGLRMTGYEALLFNLRVCCTGSHDVYPFISRPLDTSVPFHLDMSILFFPRQVFSYKTRTFPEVYVITLLIFLQTQVL